MLELTSKDLTLSPKTQNFLSFFPNTVYTYIPDYEKDMPVLHSEILDLNNQAKGYGVFFTVNGFHGGKRSSENLTNINAFFADIDFPDKINRSPQLISEYKNDILMELYEEGVTPTAIVETKNGFHVYWNLIAPIFLDKLAEDQRQRLNVFYRDIEEAILARFDGDPGAKDLSRVLRVPETYHQKDKNDPVMVKLVHFAPDNRYKFSDIQEHFMKKESPNQWAIAQGENPINKEVREQIEKAYPLLERPSYKRLFSKDPGSVPEGMRNKALLVAAYAAKESGWTIEKTWEHFTEFHGLSIREIRKTIRSAFQHNYDFGYNNEVMQQVVPEEERVKLSQVTSKVLSADTKDARIHNKEMQKNKFNIYEQIIAERYPYLRYQEEGDFYQYFDGVYEQVSLDTLRSLFLSEMAKDGLHDYRRVSAVNDKIACLKSLPGRMFTLSQVNQNPYIVNIKNGLLDVRNYTLIPHRPEYISTWQVPIAYNPHVDCPRWKAFVSEVMDGDLNQVRLLRQIAGYLLTADTHFAKAFIFYGKGGNGKSMFARTMAKMVGEHATSSVNLTTLNQRFGLTGIMNKKLNIIDEISGNYFESNVIKALISGEKMHCEIKYRPEPIEFYPTAKILFSVNELPRINDNTPGFFRRFIIVPFGRSFIQNPDTQLEEKLTEELPGILNWAIEGLKDLRSEGKFLETEVNQSAHRLFRRENSPALEMLITYYQSAPSSEISSHEITGIDLFRQYREYCRDFGYKSKSLVNFYRELEHVNSIDAPFTLSIVFNQKGNKVVKGIRPLTNASGDLIHYGPGI